MEADFHRIYELERSMLELEKDQTILKESIAKARYDLRTAKANVLEYEGSLRSFLDRFRGTKEANSEQLHRALRHAQDLLPRLERELEALQQNLANTKATLAQLPSPEEIPACREKYILEADLCLYALAPMLEETLQALLDCRALEQGQRVGEIISVEERQEILSKPHTAGALCTPWLQRLENAMLSMDMPLQIPSFFQSPAAYLAVTQYTHRDRINAAIDQTLQMKKLLPQLKNSIQL